MKTTEWLKEGVVISARGSLDLLQKFQLKLTRAPHLPV